MSISYWIDPIRRIILICGEGTITAQEASDLRDALNQDTRFRPSFRELVDHRGVLDIALTTNGYRGLQALNPYGQGSRRAIVAPRDAVYGVARMFQLTAPQSADEIEIFRAWVPALEWLGIAEAELPAGDPDWQTNPIPFSMTQRSNGEGDVRLPDNYLTGDWSM